MGVVTVDPFEAAVFKIVAVEFWAFTIEPVEVAHQFLPACQQQFREALEVERFLARAPDPLQSRRAQEYCDLIAQGVSNGCMATSETFCYLHVCQQLVEQRR